MLTISSSLGGYTNEADVPRKVVGDFRGWDKDAAICDKAFDRLLKGL